MGLVCRFGISVDRSSTFRCARRPDIVRAARVTRPGECRADAHHAQRIWRLVDGHAKATWARKPLAPTRGTHSPRVPEEATRRGVMHDPNKPAQHPLPWLAHMATSHPGGVAFDSRKSRQRSRIGDRCHLIRKALARSAATEATIRHRRSSRRYRPTTLRSIPQHVADLDPQSCSWPFSDNRSCLCGDRDL